MYIYIYIYMCVYIYIYIYIGKSVVCTRERVNFMFECVREWVSERKRSRNRECVCVYFVLWIELFMLVRRTVCVATCDIQSESMSRPICMYIGMCVRVSTDGGDRTYSFFLLRFWPPKFRFFFDFHFFFEMLFWRLLPLVLSRSEQCKTPREYPSYTPHGGWTNL